MRQELYSAVYLRHADAADQSIPRASGRGAQRALAEDPMSRTTKKPSTAARATSTAAPRPGRPARGGNGRAAAEQAAQSTPASTPGGYRPTVFLTGRTEKKAEALARQILDDIIDSGLEPGAVLPPEATMLAQYRVGRTTLREAQRILEVHGLLDIRYGPGGGPVVTAASARDFGRMSSLFYRAAGVRLHHLLEARNVMEPVAARLAAEHHTEEGIERLRQLVTDLEGGDTADNRAFLAASRSFHEVVTGISGNPIIDLFSQALADLFVDRMVGFVYPPNMRDAANKAHIAIGKAILQGKGALAERLMAEHMEEYNKYAWDGYSGGLNEVIAWR